MSPDPRQACDAAEAAATQREELPSSSLVRLYRNRLRKLKKLCTSSKARSGTASPSNTDRAPCDGVLPQLPDLKQRPVPAASSVDKDSAWQGGSNSDSDSAMNQAMTSRHGGGNLHSGGASASCSSSSLSSAASCSEQAAVESVREQNRCSGAGASAARLPLEPWEVPAEFAPMDFARHREPLAKGGFSSVYRCRDLRTVHGQPAQPLVVKVLDYGTSGGSESSSRTRTSRRAARLELEVLQALQDLPFVVKLHSTYQDEDNKRSYLLFEYLEGVMLEEVVARLHALPADDDDEYERRVSRFSPAATPTRAAEDFVGLVALQLLTTLAQMHERGIAHGDVKPQNIFMRKGTGGARSCIQLLDFGLAARFSATKLISHCKGTIPYLAPEQIRAAATRSAFNPAEADVWAAGVTLLACLFGELPFAQDSQDWDRSTKGDKWWGTQLAQEHELWGTKTYSSCSRGLRLTRCPSGKVHPMRRRLAELSRGHLPGTECEAFFGGLLALDPSQRLTAAQALEHPYMQYMRSRLGLL